MKYREIDELLRNHDLPTNEKHQLISRLMAMIQQYETQPQNRDERGVRHGLRRRERTTIKHIGSALRLRRKHPDPQVQHEATKLLRSIPHNNFSLLSIRASMFMGRVRKASWRLNEQKRQAKGREIVVSKFITLLEVRSLSLLLKVGKQLSLCVRKVDAARDYLNEVFEGSEELWVVQLKGQIAGLLQVSNRRRRRTSANETQRILEQCSSSHNDPLKLTRTKALKVLKLLHIDRVNAETFTQVGAYPIFLREDIDHSVPEPISVGNELHFVWRNRDSIAIATLEKKQYKNEKAISSSMKWSYLCMQGKNKWEDMDYMANHLNIGEVLHLVLSTPNFYQATLKFEDSRQ
ncbi:MAG: hypothetical protein F4227_06110 [Gammaproteobacteria bacterium]|nr:hypothetical protein [Gammaproteobacteria bacterium]MYF02538.1 hypothetical protein [Gammaproteobacteria bacterium]MYI76274.1 hypothetical protein [Gammaproteobacteria bacterium]